MGTSGVVAAALALVSAAATAAAPQKSCPLLTLQNLAVEASFSSCTGELLVLSRRGGANLLAGNTTAAARGPFAIWVDAPPPWVAVNALDHGTDALDGGTRSCRGDHCVALPNNGSAPLTPAGCRLVSHTLTNRSLSGMSIPELTMVLEPSAGLPSLRLTLVATFASDGARDPRLVLTLSAVNVGATPLRMQIALPYLRGVQLGNGTNGSAPDLGLQHQETGIPGQLAWGGCGGGGATSDSCGGMLGYHQSSQWQQVYAADGSQGLGKRTAEVC